MQRVIEMGDFFISAVYRQSVLNQVVGADGQKVELLDKHTECQSCGRYLDHAADFHLAIIRDALIIQILLGRGDELQSLVELRYAGQHRYQYFDVAVIRGAKQRTQLGAE